MSFGLELSHFTNKTLGSVILDREGIIRATYFSGIAFDDRYGWPKKDLVGQPFIVIHEAHQIAKFEISQGGRQCLSGSVPAIPLPI